MFVVPASFSRLKGQVMDSTFVKTSSHSTYSIVMASVLVVPVLALSAYTMFSPFPCPESDISSSVDILEKWHELS